MRVAFLATDMVEQVELTEPWKAVEEQGWTPELVSIERGKIQGFNHYDKADAFTVDRTVDDVDPDEYDVLVVPGGVGNPDRMRTEPAAVALVRSFVEQGKPTAVICHGPWQITATGLPASKNERTKLTASSSPRRKSGLATPPGWTRPS